MSVFQFSCENECENIENPVHYNNNFSSLPKVTKSKLQNIYQVPNLEEPHYRYYKKIRMIR